MKLNFIINEDYLFVHTLSSTSSDRFSSKKYKKDIIALQNLAWRKSKRCYNFLIGRLLPNDWTDKNVKSLSREFPIFLNAARKTSQYKKILLQTKKYLNFCQDQWNKNYSFSQIVMKELTGFELNKIFDVYITHPSLKNGRYLGNNKIVWGHNEDWLNYTTVYLWHEILHSYFKNTDWSHALIQLMADNELRIRLNSGKYPPFVGHENLFPLMRRMLPYWKKYLKSKQKDILKLQELLTGLKIF